MKYENSYELPFGRECDENFDDYRDFDVEEKYILEKELVNFHFVKN